MWLLSVLDTSQLDYPIVYILPSREVGIRYIEESEAIMKEWCDDDFKIIKKEITADNGYMLRADIYPEYFELCVVHCSDDMKVGDYVTAYFASYCDRSFLNFGTHKECSAMAKDIIAMNKAKINKRGTYLGLDHDDYWFARVRFEDDSLFLCGLSLLLELKDEHIPDKLENDDFFEED